MNSSNRRQFLTTTLGFFGLGALAQIASLPSTSWANAGQPTMVDPKDGTAKAIGYIEDAKKAPAAKGNKCSNCSFYAKKETRNGKEVGTCLIFPGKYVYADGYCNSWAKKA